MATWVPIVAPVQGDATNPARKFTQPVSTAVTNAPFHCWGLTRSDWVPAYRYILLWPPRYRRGTLNRRQKHSDGPIGLPGRVPVFTASELPTAAVSLVRSSTVHLEVA